VIKNRAGDRYVEGNYRFDGVLLDATETLRRNDGSETLEEELLRAEAEMWLEVPGSLLEMLAKLNHLK
jgi:hypothetical protein